MAGKVKVVQIEVVTPPTTSERGTETLYALLSNGEVWIRQWKLHVGRPVGHEWRKMELPQFEEEE